MGTQPAPASPVDPLRAFVRSYPLIAPQTAWLLGAGASAELACQPRAS